jgi:hypothetical protein
MGISVQSALGKGSTFSFILENKPIPIDEFDENMPSLVIPLKRLGVFQQIKVDKCCPKILIVDDEPFNIIALRAILLKRFGYKCDKSFDGKQAIEMIRDQKNKSCECSYSLILLDCNMPIMNGYETCRKIR